MCAYGNTDDPRPASESAGTLPTARLLEMLDIIAAELRALPTIPPVVDYSDAASVARLRAFVFDCHV